MGKTELASDSEPAGVAVQQSCINGLTCMGYRFIKREKNLSCKKACAVYLKINCFKPRSFRVNAHRMGTLQNTHRIAVTAKWMRL